MIKSVLQIGSVNWQTKEESTSGSGILHEGHHKAYKELGLKVYSLYPSRVHKLGQSGDVGVFHLDHEIPIFTNIPTSSYRFSDMTEEQYVEYESRLKETLKNFIRKIESNQSEHIGLAVAHHAFINAKVMCEINREREEAGVAEIPVVAFVHGTELKMYQRELAEGKPRFLKTMQNEIENISGVFTISKDQKVLFHELFSKYPKINVTVSPNGFDESVFNIQAGLKKNEVLAGLKTTETSGSKPLPSDADYVVSFVGKFAEWKRLHALLHAAKIYNEVFEADQKKVITIVAGTGTPDQVSKYEGLALELGLENIYFVGPKMHPTLAKIYNISDVGVFPSKDEPFGLVLLECMACGTPVIGANSGGPKDFISDDVGYLVPESLDDLLVKNIADAVVLSWRENWKRKKGIAAHALAHTKYTLKVQVKGILEQAEKFISSGQ